MLQRKLTLVEIGGSALPSPSPAAPRYANWFPMPYKAAAVPPVEGVTPNPVADGVLIEWAAVDQEGVIYVIERGPSAQGPWTEIHRTTETRYLYSDGSGQKWWFRITPTVRGKAGAGSTVEATPPTTTADLVEQQEKLAAETLARMRADAAETAARAAAMAQAAQDLLAEATLRQQQYTQAMQGIAEEARARADAVLNEKLAREAAINLEQQSRQSEVESLARALSEVAAGSGTQFDSRAIWYFDQTVEGWTGNGAPTLVDGWLRPANAAATPWVQSPAALAVDGSAYRFVKLRVKRVGSPTWAGFLQWITPSDQNWTTQKRVAIAEPAWDANGVATVDVQDIAWWPGTVDRIRLQLGGAQTVANYYLVDWVAVGRPTPGASVALVQAETVARTNAIAAEASQRNTLAVQMRGNYTGTDPLQLTAGLAYEELKARVAADSAQVQRINAMEVRMPAGTGNLATAASVTEEALARAAADNATASTIVALRADIEGKASNAALQSLQSQVTLQGNDITSLGTAITNVSASLGNVGGENLLANSSFEAETASAGAVPGWGNNSGGMTGQTSRRTWGTSTLPGSTRSWRWELENVPTTSYLEAISNGALKTTKIVPGQKHTLSTYVRGTPGARYFLQIAWRAADGTTISYTGLGGNQLLTSENWERKSFTTGAAAPANAVRADAYLRIYGNNAAGQYVEWDNVQLEVGDTASGYKASIEELQNQTTANASATTALTGTVSTLQGQVTALGQSVTTVNARIDGIGGDNLLPNSSFEESTSLTVAPTMWNLESASPAVSVSYVNSPLAGGGRSVRLSATTTAANQWIGLNSLEGAGGVNLPRVQPNTDYVLSSNVRGTAGCTVQIIAQWRNSANGIVATTTLPATALTGDWQRLVLPVKTTAAAADRVRLYVGRITSPTAQPIFIEIDNVMLQQGTVANAYMPSVAESTAKSNANAAATSTLQGQVTTLQGTVTAQGTAITTVNAEIARGRNSIWPVGTFEQWADGTVLTNVAGGTTYTVKNSAARNGARGLEINVTANTAPSNNADLYIGDFIPVSGNRVIYVEFYARLAPESIDNPTGSFGIGVNTQSEAAANSWPRTNDASNTLSKTAWTKRSAYLTLNANSAKMRIFMSVPSTNRQVGTIIQIDDVIWQDVTDAQAAQTTASGAASGVSSLQATVTQQGQQITAQASRIDGVQASVGGKADAQVVQEMRVQVNNQGGGGNLIPNSSFPNWDRTGWGWDWNPSGWQELGDPLPGGGSLPFIPYGVKSALGSRKGGYYNVGAADNVAMQNHSFPLDVAKTYCVSAYVGTHRCRSQLLVECIDFQGNIVGYMGTSVNPPRGQSNMSLAQYPRDFFIGSPPQGTVRGRLIVQISGNNESDPYFWIVYPMVCEVAAGATKPPPYEPGDQASAQWNLAVQANGVSAGMQLGITGQTSALNILANAVNILTPGGADGFEMTQGYLRVWSGNSQRIIGNGFGGDGLVDYFGPNVGAANANKTNATMWMDRNGDAYWGGAIAAGILRNANQSTSIQTIGNGTVVGPFDTNGRNKQVVVGFNRQHRRVKQQSGSQGFVAGAGSNGGVINLYRQLDGQAEALWQQISISGSVDITNEFDGPDNALSYWSASVTLNDNANGTTRRSYRAEIVNFTEQNVTHQSGSFDSQNITQSLSIVSIEQ